MKEQVLIVSTPIGNLDDMSIRGIRALEEADVILCEDTRHSIKLLNHFNIKSRLVSYHKFNERERIDYILSLLSEGNRIALISDAGTPLVSDPGKILIDELISADIDFSVVPGANALLPALIMSGLDNEHFTFVGFLPKKAGKREEMLESFSSHRETLIFYCSPRELNQTLSDMKKVFGNRKAALVKEITKIHESTDRGTLEELIVLTGDKNLKGEYVIAVEGLRPEEKSIGMDELEKLFRERTENGERPKDVVKALSREYNMNRRELYSKLMTK